ncbi:MAG TPA: hypothetical protein VM452_16960 [Caulifigura sp.]|nr:hypothetical protein [Caulifigura sp.]
MPIKFRCTHCNQFLGISRAQSRGIVDCPSCGRSIRVPNLDGTVEPLPKPAIDLKDHALADALEQLASLEQGVAEAPPTAAVAKVAPPVVVVAEPIVAAPIEPLIAAETDIPVAGDPSPRQPWIEVEEELSRLASPAPAERTVAGTRSLARRDFIVAALTTSVIAPLTWWLASRSRETTPKLADENLPPVNAAAAAPAPAAESAPALTGRITYVTADGESRPDAGARVLLFPENRQGSTLLSVEGFRANAAAADLQLARDSMKLYGGAFVTADEQGRYGADLSSSGTYEILIISNYQSRPAGQLPPDLLKALGRYFDRPQLLIGQTAYEFSHFRFTGREPAVRDQVFQRT